MGYVGRGKTVEIYPVYVRKAHSSVQSADGNADIHGEYPYVRPEIRLVSINSDADLLGVIETSGEPGPHVDPDHPADPDDPDLVSHGSVWEDIGG